MRFVPVVRASVEDVVDAAFAFGLTVVALYAFQQSFGGVEYLVLGTIGAILGVVTATVGNRKKAPALVVLAVLLLVYLVVGATIALRADAIAGFVPTALTLRGGLHSVIGGWKELLTTVPPVGRVGTLMAIPMFCGIISAGGSTLWSKRVRASLPVLILPTAVMILGLLCGLKKPVSVWVHGVIFAAGIIVWVAVRSRRVRAVVRQSTDRRRRVVGAVGLVAAASVIGLVVAPSLPFVHANEHARVTLRNMVEPPFDPFQYPSPLSGYRNFVKSQKTDVLFTITGLPEGVPVRLATMDAYDGIVWTVTGGVDARAGASGYFQRVGTDVAADFPGQRAKIKVEVKSWSQVWMPTVGEVLSVAFGGPRARQLADAYRYNSATDTAAIQGRLLQPGDSYVMDVVITPPQASSLGGTILNDSGKSSSNYVPQELLTWAAPLVKKVELSKRGAALAKELAATGVYSDGNTGDEPSLGGHNVGRLKNFIAQNQPVGDAEQFSAALGLMLRGDNIPARVVAGFAPRKWKSTPMDITGEDAEAWVEIPIVGVGWSKLTPTPPRTQKTPQVKPAQRPQGERNTQIPPPPPILAQDPRSEPAKVRQAKPGDKKPGPDTRTSTDGGASRVIILGAIFGGPPLILIGGATSIILGLKARRRRRRRSQGSGTQRVSNGWRELLDTARDYGRPIPNSATRRELAGFVGTGLAASLAARADAAVFAPGETSDDSVNDYWDELEHSMKELGQQVGLVDRVKARLSLTSLRKAKSS